MRWTRIVLLSVLVVLVAFVLGGGRLAIAQDPDMADHPAVGSWAVESDPGDASFSLTSVTLAADGTALYISPNADVGIGVWTPSGDDTAVWTFRATTDGPAYILIRVSIEVPPDGATFTGTFTVEIDPSIRPEAVPAARSGEAP